MSAVTVSSSRRPMARLAALLGVSEGRAATAVVMLLVTVVLIAGGLPPVLRQRDAIDAASASLPPLASSPAPVAEAAAAPSPAASAAPAAPFVPPASTPVVASHGPRSTPAPPELDESGAEAAFFRTPPSGSVVRFAPIAPMVPTGIAVDREGTVYVATSDPTGATAARIVTFAATGSAGRSYDLPSPAVDGVALDDDGHLVVVDRAAPRVLRLGLDDGHVRELATVPDLPACVLAVDESCEPGPVDHAPSLRGVVTDGDGVLYVTDAGQATVWRIRGGEPAAWFQDTALAGGAGADGIAFDASGDVLLAATETLDLRASVGGAVYRIPVENDGAAGTAVLVAAFGRGDAPTGVTAGPGGAIVVALHRANAIVVLDDAGGEVRRIAGPAGGVALDGPSHLSFQRSTLLVTNQSPSDPAQAAVVAAGVGA